jgi:excisionase family DNA binding protein
VGLDTPRFDKSAKSDIHFRYVKTKKRKNKLLRTSEVADLLLVSNRTIQRWADKNIIKAKVLPSGHRRFDEKEINKMKRGQ